MKIYMEKSMQRLLSVILALVLAVGLFLSVTSVHAADDVQAFWEAVEAYDTAVYAFWEKPDAFWDTWGELLDSGEPLSESQWDSVYEDWKTISPQEQEEKKKAVKTAYDNLNNAYNTLTKNEKEDVPDPEDPESESPSTVMTGVNKSYQDVEAWEFPELPESPYLQAYLDRLNDEEDGIYPLKDSHGSALSAYADAYTAYMEELDKENPDSDTLDSLYETAFEKYDELMDANNAVEAEYEALKTLYNKVPAEEKDIEWEDGNGVSIEWNGLTSEITDLRNEMAVVPSPNLPTYLKRLDAEDGIYALIGSAGDAMAAFDEANDAYQEELSKENPDSDTLDSLYETAMEKYTEFTAAKDAMEAEYDALKALYNKLSDKEKAIVYGDGNGVSIEWNSLTEEITALRSDMAQKEEPVKNITVEEDIQPGTPSTKLVYTDKEALLDCIGLTDEEKSSASIEVVFHVASKTITPAEAITAAAKMPENYEVGTVLDLSMQLNMYGTKARDITETDSPISVSVTIPQNLINTDTTVTRTYKIIRIHNNVASVLDGTYNPQDKSLTFSTDCFSTYVIIYKDEKTNTTDTKPSGNTNATDTKPTAPPAKVETTTTSQTNNAGTTVNAVNTGDETPLGSIFAIMIASLVLGTGCIGFNVWQRKKNPVK